MNVRLIFGISMILIFIVMYLISVCYFPAVHRPSNIFSIAAIYFSISIILIAKKARGMYLGGVVAVLLALLYLVVSR